MSKVKDKCTYKRDGFSVNLSIKCATWKGFSPLEEYHRFATMGEPLQLVFEDEEHNLIYNNEVAEKIFGNEKVARNPVSVISITGNEREGKSMLQNCIARGLESSDLDNCLGNLDEPLKGFAFKRGRHSHTRGIFVWSKPFIRTLTDGRKIAIILMDTQGLFGTSTVNDGKIIAFCGFVSSLQIHNVHHHLQSDRLQQLEVFMRYARDCPINYKVFQELKILVRDWEDDDDFGFDGGNSLLRDRFSAPENKHISSFLQSSFSEPITCFLMAHPGANVRNSQLTGYLNQLDILFVNHLNKFISTILNSLKIKTIAGKPVTGQILGQFFKDCYEAIRDQRPLGSIYETHIKSNCDDTIKQIGESVSENYNRFIGKLNTKKHWNEMKIMKCSTGMRNQLVMLAEIEFGVQTNLREELLEQYVSTLKVELNKILDPIDASHLKSLCNAKLRLLQVCYCEAMENFAHRRFLSYLITSKERLKQKHNYLIALITNEFEKICNGDSSRKWCIAQLNENLNSVLKQHYKKRKWGWISVGLLTLSIPLGFTAAAGSAAGATVGATSADVALASGRTVAMAGAKASLEATKAASNFSFKTAQLFACSTAAVNTAVSTGIALKQDHNPNKKPDPDQIFHSIVKELVTLVESYLAVDGDVKHLDGAVMDEDTELTLQ